MVRDDWETVWDLNETGLQAGYPWHFVTELIGDWTLLRLIAEGVWDCLGEAVKPCGPNGHPQLALASDRLTVQAAAAGALIGKFGGSNAGRGETGAFVIGSHCVVPMPEKKNALLFIGINGATPCQFIQVDRIRLEICGLSDS